MNGIRLVAVKEYQIDTAYGFIKECTNWLNSKGIPQWRTIYPKEKFLDDIRQEVVYLFTKDEVAVGTVSLYKKPPSYYPDKVFNDNVVAWYVCRLAVSRGRGSNRVYGKATGVERLKEGQITTWHLISIHSKKHLNIESPLSLSLAID